MTSGLEKLAQVAGDPGFVVDCKVNPAASAGQVKTTLPPEAVIAGGGGAGHLPGVNHGRGWTQIPARSDSGEGAF